MSDSTNAGGPTAPAAQSGTTGVIRSPVQEAVAAEEWSVEAFLGAEPYPLPEVTEEQLRRLSQADLGTPGPQGPAGGQGLVPGGLPRALSEAAADTQPTATSGGYNYPGPYNAHEPICPDLYPYVTVGKLFFKQNGGSYVASAAAIGNYAIWTAGHCVHAGDGKPTGWSTNMVFVPRYRDGNSPLGQWSVSWLATRTAWYQNGNPNGLTEDMGAGVVRPLNGRKISEAVGWLGFSWNWGRFQMWHQLGYPAAPPFNGMRLWENEASYAYDGTVPGLPPVASGSNLTGGCSGGPWVRGFGSGNWVNGHNSYRLTSRPEEMNSPYFDDRAKSLFDSVIKGTP